MLSKNSEAQKCSNTNRASIENNRVGNIDMANLAINQSICTKTITIADVSIHQDEQGRYSLNDLHKSAGGEQRHQPRYWLALQQTSDLINEIVNSGISLFHPLNKKRGCKGGTYVCKELVYSYAMWISAAFALKVIRAYDALMSANGVQEEFVSKATTDDRTPLRGLVNRIMGKTGIHYQPLYKMIHREFGVNHIDELTAKQVAEAMEYLAGKVLEGEFLPKGQSLTSLPSAMPKHGPGRMLLYLDEKGQVQDSYPLTEDQAVMSFDAFVGYFRKKGWIVAPRDEVAKGLIGAIQSLP